MNSAAIAENPLRATFKTLTPEECALFHERAAVMEFDGNLPREVANREALLDVVRQRKHR